MNEKKMNKQWKRCLWLNCSLRIYGGKFHEMIFVVDRNNREWRRMENRGYFTIIVELIFSAVNKNKIRFDSAYNYIYDIL